ncbi:MAG: pantoate--beta-alanine ligase [Deferribacterales bacterium]
MKIVSTVEEVRNIIKVVKKEGKSVGFVPTMGYLHDGHLSLVDKANDENDFVVVSIFVNPTQFGPNEDLDRYPRDLKRDESLLIDRDVDLLFYPDVKTMYPEGFKTYVNVEDITEPLCGGKRPGHFRGVATVVCKLFNIVMPDKAYFGLKDYQQYLVIKTMAKDLNFDIDIIGMPIVREADGLAMSSRNVYLKGDERESALSLNRSFAIVEEYLKKRVRDPYIIVDAIEKFISSHPYTKIDYVEIVDKDSLKRINKIDGSFLLALAVFVNKTRLIDNKIFEV